MTLHERLIATSFRGPGFDQIRIAAATVVLLHHCRGVEYADIRVDPFFHYSAGGIHFGFLALAVIRAQSSLDNRCAISSHYTARPQTEVEPALPRIFPIDPAKHLPFLLRGQGPWTARCGVRRERVESLAMHNQIVLSNLLTAE